MLQQTLLRKQSVQTVRRGAASELQRLEEMVKDILDFTRPLALHRPKESILAVVERSISIVERATGSKDTAITTKVEAPGIEVFVDSARLKQAFKNFIENAAHASSGNRPVEIGVTRRSRNPGIDIVDYGEKIDPSLQDRIFGPFFSTKQHGNGLGLPIARKIIEAHDGSLTVQNNPDAEDTFTILRPER